MWSVITIQLFQNLFNRMTSNEREFDVEEVTDPSFLMVALRDRNDTTLSEEDEVGLGGYYKLALWLDKRYISVAIVQ